jgi:hypothetical protein
MAGKKRQQRKNTTTMADTTSPRRGDKAKQRKQNSGDKEVLTHGLVPPPTTNRYPTRASTENAVAATAILQPKKLDKTFHRFDDNDEDESFDDSDTQNAP